MACTANHVCSTFKKQYFLSVMVEWPWVSWNLKLEKIIRNSRETEMISIRFLPWSVISEQRRVAFEKFVSAIVPYTPVNALMDWSVVVTHVKNGIDFPLLMEKIVLSQTTTNSLVWYFASSRLLDRGWKSDELQEVSETENWWTRWETKAFEMNWHEKAIWGLLESPATARNSILMRIAYRQQIIFSDCKLAHFCVIFAIISVSKRNGYLRWSRTEQKLICILISASVVFL